MFQDEFPSAEEVCGAGLDKAGYMQPGDGVVVNETAFRSPPPAVHGIGDKAVR